MFCQPCVACNALTSKAFARANQGKCKACSTGLERAPLAPKYPCANCGASVTLAHEPAFQEYPGASVQGGYDWYDCACGHHSTETNLRGFNIRENTRGW